MKFYSTLLHFLETMHKESLTLIKNKPFPVVTDPLAQKGV